jgi:putative ABC transport system permease protein
VFKITFYHLLRNKRVTFLMLLALSTTFYFPLLSNALSSILHKHMMSRAEQTPLIVVAKGSRFQSVLNTIYFRTETLETLPKKVYDDLQTRKNVKPIPIYNVFKAKVPIANDFLSIPIIATNQEYLKFRGLEVQDGRLFVFPGQVVIGHKLAEESGLKVGDTMLSEISNLINLNAIYPLKLRITGILKETGTEDDSMIFSALKSGWIMAGFFHGHGTALELGKDYILTENDEVTVMKKNVITYTEITGDNLGSFHFHGDASQLPLTSLIVIPKDEKTQVITAGRINAKGKYNAYRPQAVMEEFFGLIFAINKIFNSYFVLVMSAVSLFIAIIILLSARLRKDEFKTIQTLGGSRFVVFKLYLCEYSMLLITALIVAWLCAAQTISILKNIYI